MNQMIPRIGAGLVAAAVFLFAACMIAGFPFGSYLVCMVLPLYASRPSGHQLSQGFAAQGYFAAAKDFRAVFAQDH